MMRWLFVKILVFFPFLFFASGIYQAIDASEYEEGVRLYEAGRFDDAKSKFEAYLASHPDDPNTLYYLGKLELDGAKSQKYFRSLWIDHPTHPLADDALYAICQYHYAKGYYVTAGRMFRDLERIYPASEYGDDASYWSASSYLAAGHPDSALTEWQKFLTRYPRSALYDWAVLGTGDALFALGRYAEACSEYKKIADSPFGQQLKGTALYRLGQCYEQLGDTAAAQRYYRRVVEHCPQSYERFLIEGTASNPQAPQMYTVQVGAFAHKENAIKLHDLLSQKGYEVEIVSKFKEDGKFLHAVQVGSYTTREEAQPVAERLEKEEGFKPQIVVKGIQ